MRRSHRPLSSLVISRSQNFKIYSTILTKKKTPIWFNFRCRTLILSFLVDVKCVIDVEIKEEAHTHFDEFTKLHDKTGASLS